MEEEASGLLDFFEKDDGLAGIGEIIHSFRAVTKEDFHEELSAFIDGKNNGDGVRLFLQLGADVNGLVGGQSALLKAICADRMEGFQMLIDDVGVDLEVRVGPGFSVRSSNQDKVLPPLKIGDTAVMAACRQGRWGMIPSLVAKGADVEKGDGQGRKALQIACGAAYNVHVRPTVNETLRVLIMKTNLHVIREVLLHFFMERGFEHLAEVSLSRGVGVNVVDQRGCTALFRSAQKMNPKLVQLLVDRGADVNRRDTYGDTALIEAVKRYSNSPAPATREVVEILLNHGADVNVQGEFGRSALHWAAERKIVEIVKLLLEHGADVQLRSFYGKTPLDLTGDCHAELVQLLIGASTAAMASPPSSD